MARKNTKRQVAIELINSYPTETVEEISARLLSTDSRFKNLSETRGYYMYLVKNGFTDINTPNVPVKQKAKETSTRANTNDEMTIEEFQNEVKRVTKLVKQNKTPTAKSEAA